MKNLQRLSFAHKRILVLSPHPDDDCIGMGATLYFLRKNNSLKIFYLTSGWRGVKGRFSKKEKINLRKKEAISALKFLGIDKKAIKLLALPFYEKGEIGFEDIRILAEEIKRFQPQVIFTSGKEKDPHLTHEKCWLVLKGALKNLDFSPEVYIYRVWKIFKRFDVFFPFGERTMEIKIKAIQEHKSQLKLKYPKRGIFSLWEREMRLNRDYGKKLRKMEKLRGKSFLAEVFKTCPNNPEKHCYLRNEE
ncbi:MAG: PIG-L family deacetylase [Candidatus Omnitrophica bacterium]|nr:PIG-L family deacetylase [Candidatus Omnitrophota bacterium]